MKRFIVATLITAALAAPAAAAEPVPVTHRQFQAVHQDGTSSFFDDTGLLEVVLEGILLNNPEKWLDPTPDPTPGDWQMGGEWEIFVQGEDDDHAGTACWMGQNYGNGPGDANYPNEQFLAEICRLNHDPGTGHVFKAGDRIRVTGTYLFYAGKLNINENHEISPSYDFNVELVKAAVGLPQPEPISISELKDSTDTDIFDPDRLTGGEYYQGRLVRIEDVNVVDPGNWGCENTITIMDSSGLTFPVRLGLGEGIKRYDCPAGQIDVIGILDQAAPGYPPVPTMGYRLLVLDHDGGELVLGGYGNSRGNLPGDINGDYLVDFRDMAALAENWLSGRAGLSGCGQ